jgi:hypothetical protein
MDKVLVLKIVGIHTTPFTFSLFWKMAKFTHVKSYIDLRLAAFLATNYIKSISYRLTNRRAWPQNDLGVNVIPNRGNRTPTVYTTVTLYRFGYYRYRINNLKRCDLKPTL